MNIRSPSSVTSSLTTASFRTVQTQDNRGLPYRIRRAIMSMRRLMEDPLPPQRTFRLRCRIRTGRDIWGVRT